MPTTPSLRHFRDLAAALLRSAEEGDPAAISRLAPDTTPDLRAAQAAVAREAGFDRWLHLVQSVGRELVDQEDLHRWFGVDLNNETWRHLGSGAIPVDSPPSEREALLYGAYASAYHWMQVGSPINQARGEHLIARVAVRVGRPDVALHHATRCLEIVTAHPDLAEDWDSGFAHEALARSHAALGNVDAARNHRAKAWEIIERMSDEDDRAILEEALAEGEWFGVGD